MPHLEIDYIHSTMINKGEIFVFFSLSITFNSARNVACLHDGINIVTLFLADIISNFNQYSEDSLSKKCSLSSYAIFSMKNNGLLAILLFPLINWV